MMGTLYSKPNDAGDVEYIRRNDPPYNVSVTDDNEKGKCVT